MSSRFRLFSLALLIPLISVPAAFCQDFNNIAIPGTQNKAQFVPSVMNSQMQWLVGARQALNIRMTPGEGDIVNDGAVFKPTESIMAGNWSGPIPSPAPTSTAAPTATPSASPASATCQGGAASPSVNICSPLNGAAVNSPVHVVAATTDSASVKFIQIYLDGRAVFSARGGRLDANVAMGAGSRRVTVRAKDSAGVTFNKTIFITVQSAIPTPTPIPSPAPVACQADTASPSVDICSPLNGATLSSPVHVAAATADSVAVKFIQIYVDGRAVFTTSGGSLDTDVAMPAGSRRVTVEAKDSAGVVFKKTISIILQ